MPLKRALLTIVLAITVLLSTGQPGLAQDPGSVYFPETGHWVKGEFLRFYQQAKNPSLLYGNPLTDAFQDPLTGLTVQYFQRARFEMHTESASAPVQLSMLGELLYEAGQPSVNLDPKACRFFPRTGRYVCYAFLTFYDSHGGAEQFGEPISDLEREDEIYVQYFQNARFEWHPEATAGQRVILSELGRIYFDRVLGDDRYTRPSPGNDLPASEIRLRARAFVERAVVSPNSQQRVYVVIQDQYLRPVSGVSVALTVHFPGGSEERYRLSPTDADGISRLDFQVGNLPVDRIVEIQAEASQGVLQARAGTWFRVWW